MASVLETAMNRFLGWHLGGERIDDLPLSDRQKAGRKADYFLAERSVVVELKLLVEDRTSAVQRVLDEFRRRPDWPELQRGLRGDGTHPRTAEFRRRMFAAVTKSIERCAEHANQQIAETVQNFALAAPHGVLVFLNERAELLEPGAIAAAASNALRTKRATGARALEHVDSVLVVTRARAQPAADRDASSRVLCITADENVVHAQARAFAARMMDEWSAFLERPARDGGTREPSSSSSRNWSGA